MGLSIEQCIENAKKRAWEPYQYSSKEAQEKNLPMLIDWIASYETRNDTFSKQALHHKFEVIKSIRESNN